MWAETSTNVRPIGPHALRGNTDNWSMMPRSERSNWSARKKRQLYVMGIGEVREHRLDSSNCAAGVRARMCGPWCHHIKGSTLRKCIPIGPSGMVNLDPRHKRKSHYSHSHGSAWVCTLNTGERSRRAYVQLASARKAHGC